MAKDEILFVSTVVGWESCEELWSRAAVNLVREGFSVSASVVETSPIHPRIQDLRSKGIRVRLRPVRYSLRGRAWHYLFFKGRDKAALRLGEQLKKMRPRLVVLSEGNSFPPIEMLELCVSQSLPFVTISHLLWEDWWPLDKDAARYRAAFSKALRCYFVSQANLRLMEKQVGFEFPNAEVVRNPFNTEFDSPPEWPALRPDGELRLACVARLYTNQKGQDLLLEALASSAWANRRWHLTLYGKGPMQESLERLAIRLRISERVTFAGYVNSVKEIWASNHVLVMPSRYEGLPLAVVEAMLCGRPIVATDVAGHREVITDGVTGFLAGPPTVPTLAEALEKLWANRANLEDIGKAAAKRIRELVPADPGRVFADKLRKLVS